MFDVLIGAFPLRKDKVFFTGSDAVNHAIVSIDDTGHFTFFVGEVNRPAPRIDQLSRLKKGTVSLLSPLADYQQFVLVNTRPISLFSFSASMGKRRKFLPDKQHSPGGEL